MKAQQILDITSLDQLNTACDWLFKQVKTGQWIYLQGDLGTGKTAFSQCFIKKSGYQGIISSPTYAIMNVYETSRFLVAHSDLYRLGEPEELYEIGLTDYQDDTIHLVEWPQKGEGVLPKPNWLLNFELSSQKRTLTMTQY